MDADGPSPAAGPHRGHISSRATSALAAVSVVLILLYLFSRFLCQCRKHATSSGAGSAGGATATSSPSSPSRAAAACLGAGEAAPARRARGTATTTSLLPVFVRVEAAAAGRGAEKAADCAVCLAEIGVREAAGLVPGCGHVFHAECIEAWFRVNSTCPLCRAAVAAAGQGAGEAPLCSNV
ncbi:hypothetical protein ACP70R_048784 [Stipagrostis hirtigluma subsp. patula]